MTRIASFLVLVGLTACSPSESEQAERELNMIERSGSDPGEECAAKRQIAAAYLHENDEEKYKLADLSADIACRRAALEGF